MQGAYDVKLAPSAARELKVLQDALLKRVLSILRDLRAMPRPRGCKKLVGGESDYRVRVGEYRVIYRVNDVTKTVTVWRIRHRSEAYD